VHVTPREQERLLIFTAAELARRRLARGARLGATEAIALVCDEVLEMAWDGMPIDEVVQRAHGVVSADQVLPGVANTVPSLQVEALFPHGTSLVHVPQPFGPADPTGPGAVLAQDGDIELAPGRVRREVEVTNRGDRAVWVSSHFPLEDVNPALELDREAVRGFRLDLPAGVSLQLTPGSTRVVPVVARRSQQ
jgi:urease subunit gamma/beta